MNSAIEIGFGNTWAGRTRDCRCKVQLVDITKPCRPYGSNRPDDRAVWVDLRSVPVPLLYGREQIVILILLFISHFFLRKRFA